MWWSSKPQEGSTTERRDAEPTQPAPESTLPHPTVPDKPRARSQSDEDAHVTSLLYGFTETSQPSSPPSAPPQPSENTIAPLPETMSCRQTFDDAFHCQSLGGQFLNVYRYGELRECKELWSQFFFCMRNRSASEEVKRERVREWYAKKEERYAGGPSSCDVWEERRPEERVQRAFDWDPEAAGYLTRRSVVGVKREGAGAE